MRPRMPLPHRLARAAAAALALGAAAEAAAATERVGVAAGLNPAATGLAPGQELRILSLGDEVLFRERIRTEAAGQVQLLFIDQSSLTVGPSSDVLIDEFVFDPKTSAGRTAMTLTRGVARYVGGKISKQEAVKITTPSAVIGIRGGIGVIQVGQAGGTKAIFLFGKEMTVATPNGTQTVKTPGFVIEFSPGGVPNTRKATPDEIQAAKGQFEKGGSGPSGPGGGGQGGDSSPESLAQIAPAAGGDGQNLDQQVASSGVSNANSNANPAPQTPQNAPPPPPPTSPPVDPGRERANSDPAPAPPPTARTRLTTPFT